MKLLPESFSAYPPEAKQLAVGHLDLFRSLPIALLELLLQQIAEFDWRFPAERWDITQQLGFLESLPLTERRKLLAGFENLNLPPSLAAFSSSRSPAEYSEQLSAHLWATGQIDAFRQAAARYLAKFNDAKPPLPPLPTARLGIAVIGKGVETTNYRLFRKLRAYGTCFSRVDPADGLQALIEAALARAAAHPQPFAHWYVDGDKLEATPASSPLAVLSYSQLAPIRKALLSRMDKAIRNGISGPEAMLTMLHKLRPEQLGLSSDPHDAVLNHFQTTILTSGSGTQIFSTSYVQWAARELWRRAAPLTILARFTPRQRERPMNELLAGDPPRIEFDPEGSLIDADMAAFYMWLEMQRLPKANQSSLLVWFENHGDAFLIAPGFPQNTESNNPVNLPWLLKQVS